MAIDFRLTSHQRELRLESRKFAADVLANSRAAELLPTPEERFRATKPVYEAMVAAGFLRKCIPIPAGGDNAGLIDMAIMAEEFYSVNASITLTMLGTVLGLLPILLAGTPEQAGRLVKPFLKKSGARANAAAPLPGEGVRTVAELKGDDWIITGDEQLVRHCEAERHCTRSGLPPKAGRPMMLASSENSQLVREGTPSCKHSIRCFCHSVPRHFWL